MHRSLDMPREERMLRRVLVILFVHHTLAHDLKVVLPISSAAAEREFTLRRVSTRDGEITIDTSLRHQETGSFSECFFLETRLVRAASEAIVVCRFLRARCSWSGGGRRVQRAGSGRRR